MVIDWSGVPMNTHGCPLGFIRLTPSLPPGRPIYVAADSIIAVETEGPNSIVNFGVGRLTVRENVRDVFRLRAEADTVETKPATPPMLAEPPPDVKPPGVPIQVKPDRVRKK